MKRPERTIEVAPSIETESRRREGQLLINIAEPDPQYQPFIVTDEASLLDAVAPEPAEISRRLDAYFGASQDWIYGRPSGASSMPSSDFALVGPTIPARADLGGGLANPG